MQWRTDRTRAGASLAALLGVLALLFAAAPFAHAFPAPRAGLELALTGNKSWYPEQPFGGLGEVDEPVSGGYAAGGTLEWRLTGPFALETGLRYSLDTERRDYTFEFLGYGGYETVMRTRLHRIGLPVRLRMDLPFLRGLRAEGTAETQYLLQARRDDRQDGDPAFPLLTHPRPGRIASPSAIIFESYTGQEDITGMYPRWNLALGGGLGWEFPLGKVTGTLRARYQQGVSDQTKTPDAKNFSRVAELGLGVRW
jgi:hypothetical protein